MVKYDWRRCFTHGFPKLIELSKVLEDRLKTNHPKILKHLEMNSMIISGTFTGHIMTFGLDKCPLEISTRLFEIFILEGEQTFLKVIIRMFDLKSRKI